MQFMQRYQPDYLMNLGKCIGVAIAVPGVLSKLWKLRMLLKLRRKLGPADIWLNHYLRRNKMFVTIPTESRITNISDGETATHRKLTKHKTP